MAKYFDGVETLTELKSLYRKLAFELHPDMGGNAKKFSAMQTEYEQLFEVLKRAEYDKEAENNPDEARDYDEMFADEVDDGFIDIVEVLIKLKGIKIELCGNWLWLSGNTKAVKTELRQAGCFWAPKKRMWYWRPSDYRMPHNRKHYSMSYIRGKYGSTRIVANDDEDEIEE